MVNITTNGPNATPGWARAINVKQAEVIDGVPESADARDIREGLGLLTDGDWAVVSASVGRPVYPDKDGWIPEPGAPTLAYTLADMRKTGALKGPVTAGTIGGLLAGGEMGPGAAQHRKELLAALAFLQDREQRSDPFGLIPRRTIDIRA